ncbi:MAG: ATP-binding cassette domain-containing protein, partial [Longimicrobiales bacterium]|nr:ATP-binding cassette domain-containing protein [Longimicrobiales bacterium]
VQYFDQHRAQLDEAETVVDAVAGGQEHIELDGKPRHVMSYLADFLFTPERARQPVRSLSGGERNRLLLARLFTRRANVLVLDEPTNDLDAETLELLESRLVEFAGTVLVVSHDRAFLDNLCTSTLVFEGGGRIREFVGGYSDWKRVAERQSVDAQGRSGAKDRPKGRAKSSAGTANKKRKLAYKEQRELAMLPAKIEELETALGEAHELLADPDAYRTDAAAAAGVARRAKELEQEIEAAFERWSELADPGT